LTCLNLGRGRSPRKARACWPLDPLDDRVTRARSWGSAGAAD